MAKYKPKDLRVKTSDELKDHLKLLRKIYENFRLYNFLFRAFDDGCKV